MKGSAAATIARAERRVVTAETLLSAEPARVFEILCNPWRHVELDGSQMLQGKPSGPARLQLGSEFTMAMRQSRWRYRSTNRVVEFEEGRLIAWASMGVWRGRPVIGGQRWRWLLTPAPSATHVSHSYVWGYAALPMLTVWLPGYPARAQITMPHSLEYLRAIVER